LPAPAVTSSADGRRGLRLARMQSLT
jgi:hypothetical protein